MLPSLRMKSPRLSNWLPLATVMPSATEAVAMRVMPVSASVASSPASVNPSWSISRQTRNEANATSLASTKLSPLLSSAASIE